MRIIQRFRPAIVMLAAASVVAAGACSRFKDQLLEPQQPGLIGPDQLGSPTAADALRKGALGRLRTATVGGSGNNSEVWTLTGLFADEWKSGDTFTERVAADQRLMQDNNASANGMFTAEHRLRGAALDAINALRQYLPEPAANIGQMYWVMGLAEMQLSEAFCDGIPFSITVDGVPTYDQPRTTVEGFQLAQSHLDSALAVLTASDTFAISVKNAALITKARTLVDLGRFSDAAALVAGIPTNYQYLQTFSLTVADNPMWSFNTSQKRWVLGDSVDALGTIKNAIPFASANDPRVPKNTTASTGRAFDTSTPFVSQGLWARSDAVPIVSGIDARLIEAEAKLQANDIAGMMSILNALRATSQKIGVFTVPVMPALATPANTTAATSLYFREKAFWTFGRGQRMGDLRRLVRQYKRAQEDVFPTGSFFKGGTYGTDVNFPIPTSERPNPQYKGCLNRNA
jgi:hypothetical protein